MEECALVQAKKNEEKIGIKIMTLIYTDQRWERQHGAKSAEKESGLCL